MIGENILNYTIEGRLAGGGMANVYKARHQRLGTLVAVKILNPVLTADAQIRQRFENEAKVMAGLNHPNITRVLDYEEKPDRLAIVMEYLEGEDLNSYIKRKGALPLKEAQKIYFQILDGFQYAHDQGVVHRDVKPGNILMRPASPGTPNSVQLEELEYPVVPLLTDFGIARALDAPELTNMGRTVGTPAYMAPEQCAGSREVDGRADIYALGAVLYRCITGRMPFAGTTTQILHAHVYEPLTIDEATYRQLSPLMVEVLQRSLAKRPEDR
ncbi:MAG: serine/threonine protein kinase, partial [Phaeodactylibacter sp.]|nr:serine/threonine protein kinase [Phaeodactylibacter sp.]